MPGSDCTDHGPFGEARRRWRSVRALGGPQPAAAAGRRRPSSRVLVVMLALAALARVAAMLLVPPGSDVFYYDAQAAQALLSGQTPYGYLFTGMPAGYQTPGAEHVFAYLPLSALYQVPFHLLGDVRLGFVLADLVVGASLYLLGGRGRVLSALYLFTPATVAFSTVYLNETLVAMLFLSLFVLLERGGRGTAGALCLGLSLASIQFIWFVLPFALAYYLRRSRLRDSLLSLAVAAVVLLPFFLQSPYVFLQDTIGFQFARHVVDFGAMAGPLGYNVNFSLSGLLLSLFSLYLPGYVRLLLVGGILPIFVLGVRGLDDLLVRAAGYLLVVVFVLPNESFWAYVELPFFLVLAYLSVSQVALGGLGNGRRRGGGRSRHGPSSRGRPGSPVKF